MRYRFVLCLEVLPEILLISKFHRASLIGIIVYRLHSNEILIKGFMITLLKRSMHEVNGTGQSTEAFGTM